MIQFWSESNMTQKVGIIIVLILGIISMISIEVGNYPFELYVIGIWNTGIGTSTRVRKFNNKNHFAKYRSWLEKEYGVKIHGYTALEESDEAFETYNNNFKTK